MEQNEWEERERMYACWLCNFPDIGNKQLHLLSDLCGGPEAVYFSKPEIWGKVLKPDQVESLKAYTADWHPEEEYHKMQENGIRLVTIMDAAYPGRLKEIPDAPYGLFFRGRLPMEEAPAVAVIGARECSEYGKYVARQLGTVLGKNGIPLISGMAKGIDGISQEAALEAGGYSAGVLGNGVDICYPAQNRRLYEKLMESGAVISSYPLGTPAYARNFPPRNRIVSGLADAVVVIEARAKSGTLITVDMALEQGREVYVVPGRVTDRLSDGCNRLIRQGAGMLLCLEEFLEEIRELRERKTGLGFRRKRTYAKAEYPRGESKDTELQPDTGNPKDEGVKCCLKNRMKSMISKDDPESDGRLPAGLPDELAAVWHALDLTPKSAEEIQAGLPRKYQEQPIAACLMRLTLEGLAVQVSPGHFCLKG